MTIAPTPPEVSAQHTAALADRKAKSDRVRYAVEHNPDASVPELLDWLAAHGANPTDLDTVPIKREYAAGIVKSYREGRRTTDTGDLPRLTDEVLAEFDAATPAAITGAGVQTVRREGVSTDPSGTVETPSRESTGSDFRMTVPVEPTPAAVAAIALPIGPPVETWSEPVQTVRGTAAATEESISASTEVRTSAPAESAGKARGTGPFYLVAFACSILSLDTAARFFSERMGIDGFTVNGVSVELAAVCGIGEMTLVACGYAMRHSARRSGKPGSAQLLAFVLCAAATAMAIALDGPVEGAFRAFFGSILALIALHHALGIEVHVRTGGTKSGTLARVIAEVRERALSRGGGGGGRRDAGPRTRDRAIDRAARLATVHWAVARKARLTRAIRQSGVALDPAARARLVAQVNAQRNATDLLTLNHGSPWN